MQNAITSPFELVIFDWDGTLMDSEAVIVHCMRSAIQGLGLEPRSDQEISNIIGLGLNEAVTTLYPGTDEPFAQRVADGYRVHWFNISQSEEDLFPGVERLLQHLRAEGIKTAIATGKSRKGLNLVLQETGIAHLFDASRCADETQSKPHPQMIHELLEELQVEPAAAVMVGDTEWDLSMAHRAGIASVGVCYGVHESHRLRQHAPLACIEAISEIREILPLAAPAFELA